MNKKQLRNFCQILDAFFSSVESNATDIDKLLGEFKNLRKEYLEAIKEKVIPELLKENNLPNLKEKLNSQQLLILLGTISASFRSEQEKSYQFLENTICEELLTRAPQEAMEQGFVEINELREECSQLRDENDEMKQEKFQADKRLIYLEERAKDLEEQLALEREKNEEQRERIQNFEDFSAAIEDYEYIIMKIRQEVEGKSTYDSWRLKTLYNRVAALTGSTWSYSGIPEQDSYKPQSQHARKFLDSIKPDH